MLPTMFAAVICCEKMMKVADDFRQFMDDIRHIISVFETDHDEEVIEEFDLVFHDDSDIEDNGLEGD